MRKLLRAKSQILIFMPIKKNAVTRKVSKVVKKGATAKTQKVTKSNSTGKKNGGKSKKPAMTIKEKEVASAARLVKRNAEEVQRKKSTPTIAPPEVTKLEIDKLLANQKAAEYLKRNVSKTAI